MTRWLDRLVLYVCGTLFAVAVALLRRHKGGPTGGRDHGA
jgi:hypothetical protein